jgi:hypothetical protein
MAGIESIPNNVKALSYNKLSTSLTLSFKMNSVVWYIDNFFLIHTKTVGSETHYNLTFSPLDK